MINGTILFELATPNDWMQLATIHSFFVFFVDN